MRMAQHMAAVITAVIRTFSHQLHIAGVATLSRSAVDVVVTRGYNAAGTTVDAPPAVMSPRTI